MSNRDIVRTLQLALLVAVLGSQELPAQSEYTYDECALRMQYRAFGGVRVVQGQSAEKVGGFNFFGFAPVLPMLAEGPDSVIVNYEAFRSVNNSGAVLQAVGAAAIIAGVVVLTIDHESGWSAGLVLGGMIPLWWGTTRRVQGRDHLSRAIWWYNRGLR